MKNTPAVFLTSLAVSAISLTVPMPAATTVLDLFIGEDITAQHITETNCETRQHTTSGADGDNRQQEYKRTSDCEGIEVLRKLPEQINFIKANAEAASSLISNISIFYTRSQKVMRMLDWQHIPGNTHRSIAAL